jgi:hypothetical protein
MTSTEVVEAVLVELLKLHAKQRLKLVLQPRLRRVTAAENSGARRVAKPVQKASYPVPHDGNPSLHEEIMWYATDDDRVLGAIIRDKIDNDFGWILLTRGEGGCFRCVDVECSFPSLALATGSLLKKMDEMS